MSAISLSDIWKQKNKSTCIPLISDALAKDPENSGGINKSYKDNKDNKMNRDKVSFYNWIGEYSPSFRINGDKIKVLLGPKEFFETLKKLTSAAEKRIILASLYFGNGPQEKEFIDCIGETIRKKNNSDNKNHLKTKIILDYTRATREPNSSRSMILPLIKEFGESVVALSLYHTPDLRGILKRLLPQRFNETVGLFHMKVYLFDDTVLISGANLSQSYFTDRQDRYVLIENSADLANFYDQLFTTIADFCFLVGPDGNHQLSKELGNSHPYLEKNNSQEYRQKLQKKIQSIIHRHKYSNQPRDQSFIITNKSINQTQPLSVDTFKTPQQLNSSFLLESNDQDNNNQSTSNGNYGTTKNIPSNDSSINSTISSQNQIVNNSNLFNNPSYSDDNDNTNSYNKNINKDENNSISFNNLFNMNTLNNEINSIINKTEYSNSGTKEDDGWDTIIYPLIQMPPFNIRTDELVTKEILKNFPENSKVYLASGYFNLTQDYSDLLMNVQGSGHPIEIDVLTAAPQANSFFNAKGIIGYIPDVYTCISREFLGQIKLLGQEQRIKLWEYMRPNWTVHAKGLWVCSNETGNNKPYMTMIGSSNFGYRSVERDLETQLVIVTNSKSLQNQLHQERINIYKSSVQVNIEDLDSSTRKAPIWMKYITPFIRHFF